MYTYDGEIYCDECAQNDHRPLDGPFGNECADTPQACRKCGRFLENPLTQDGENYVRNLVERQLKSGPLISPVLREWVECNSYLFSQEVLTAVFGSK